MGVQIFVLIDRDGVKNKRLVVEISLLVIPLQGHLVLFPMPIGPETRPLVVPIVMFLAPTDRIIESAVVGGFPVKAVVKIVPHLATIAERGRFLDQAPGGITAV